MDQRKSNIISRYRLYLAAILFAACLILIVGSVWARYKADIDSGLIYAAKDAGIVQLWDVTADGDLLSGTAKWVDSEGEKFLTFGISNGTKETYSSETQRVRICLLGSIGMGYNEDMLIELHAPDPDTSETSIYEASAKRIEDNSPLYLSFGEGWVFGFFDKNGEEMSWTLDGDRFSAMVAKITVDGIEIDESVLLQLQVTGDVLGQ